MKPFFQHCRLTSSYKLFNAEIKFLKNFFRNNGFPKQLIESVIRSVLDKIFNPNIPTCLIAAKLEKYIVIPYFGAKSINLQKDIVDPLSKYYPYLNPRSC